MSNDVLRRLREVLDGLPQGALDEIGVRLDPNPNDWEWVRDCLVEAMQNCGRKAAKELANFPFAGPNTTYSVGLNKTLLAAFGVAIKSHYAKAMEARQGQDPTGLDAKHDSAGRQALPETQEDQAND